MNMNTKTLQIFVHSTPLIFGIFLSYFFWRSSFILLGIYVVLTVAIILLGRDRRTEFVVLIYGIIAGFVVETIGTQISGYQSFAKPDVFGIPFWLLVAWGYGFVLMKRIGLIIATGSPWAPRQ